MAQGQVKTIGVAYDNEDNVVCIVKVMNCNQQTYNSLKNKHIEYLEKQAQDKELLYKVIRDLNEKVDQLEKEIKLLKGEE